MSPHTILYRSHVGAMETDIAGIIHIIKIKDSFRYIKKTAPTLLLSTICKFGYDRKEHERIFKLG